MANAALSVYRRPVKSLSLAEKTVLARLVEVPESAMMPLRFVDIESTPSEKSWANTTNHAGSRYDRVRSCSQRWYTSSLIDFDAYNFISHDAQELMRAQVQLAQCSKANKHEIESTLFILAVFLALVVMAVVEQPRFDWGILLIPTGLSLAPISSASTRSVWSSSFLTSHADSSWYAHEAVGREWHCPAMSAIIPWCPQHRRYIPIRVLCEVSSGR
jgi:hypothetical protein